MITFTVPYEKGTGGRRSFRGGKACGSWN